MGKLLGHNPNKDFVQRGLISDRDVKLDEFHWGTFDYGGKLAKGTAPPLALLCEAVALDDSTVTESMVWSAGSTKEIRPVSDGTGIEAVKDVAGLSSSCNAYHFLQSLTDAGLADEVQDEPVAALNGIEVHILRKKFARSGGKDGEMSDSDIPIVTQIIRAPGETKRAAKGAGKAAAKDTAKDATAAAAANGDIDSQIEGLIIRALEAEEADIPVGKIASKATRIAISDGMPKAQRDEVKARAGDVELLSTFEGIAVANDMVAKV